MILKSLRARAAATAVALGCGLVLASPAAAQDAASAADIQQITCFVLTVPSLRTAVEAGKPPLLVVSGREIGYLRMPAACPATPRLPRGVTEFRIIAAHTAPQFYGERGRNGAVLVDLPPAAAR